MKVRLEFTFSQSVTMMKIDCFFFLIYQKYSCYLPSQVSSLYVGEVPLIEPQIQTLIGHHYKIQASPGTTEKVGAGGDVTSTNEDSKNNMATLELN